MKKHNCLLILAIACCGAARAQVEPKPAAPAQVQAPARAQTQHPPHHPAPRQSRWSFDLSGGGAFPAGQFAHPDEQNPMSGPIHAGSLLELSGTYHLNHTWGITLLASQQHHNSEVDNFSVDPTSLPIPEVSVPGPVNAGTGAGYAAIGPQHWTMTRILAGGVYTLPLNQKKNLALLVRALAGVQKTHVPEYGYSLKIQNGTGFSNFPARNLAWAFSYQADAGLQWKMYRRWSLLTFAGYNGCHPSYNQDVSEFYMIGVLMPPNPPHVFKKFDFPTGSILFRAGVGFDL